MEFQSTPGTYAAVDPFKPSISFSIKKLLGSQRPPRDDTDLHSRPPPRAAFSSRRYDSAIPPRATAAVGPRSWATWVPSLSSPSFHEVRIPGSQPPPDSWIPQASDSRIQIPLHNFQDPDLHGHARGNDSIYSLPGPNAASPRRRHESPDRRSVRSRRRRFRSSSPSSRGRERRRHPSSPLILRKPSPPTSLSRANERLHRNFDFRVRHRSRSSSPLERSRERSRSARRHHRSRSRSRSPVRFRRSRSSRRSRNPSSRSDNTAPMVVVPELSLESPSAVMTLPLFAMEDSSIMASPIIIEPGSRSSSAARRSRHQRSLSRTPHPIIRHHSPVLTSVEPPQSSPLPSSFSTEGSDNSLYGLPPSPSRTRPSDYLQMVPPPLDSIPSRAAEEPYVRRPPAVPPQPSRFHYVSEIHEKTESLVSVSRRRSTIGLSVEPPLEEIRPVGLWGSSDSVDLMTYVAAFMLDTIPRQLYLYFLLRLPYMYFSRVTRIFEEAEMSMPQIKQGILDAAIQLKEPVKDVADAWKLEPVESIQYSKLQNTWQSFIDSLMREWKTLNIISVLLLSAILTILQIESAANDPFIRYSALLSMVCALMSLFYGCIYIIRFGTMRKTYKAAEWAQEAQTSSGLFWNVWVLLAMPATWLAWSMIMYIVCIMSFVWRTGTTDDANRGPMTPQDALAFRVIVSVVLSLGLIYFVLIASTLRKYGEMMDQAWHRRIIGWVNDTVAPAPYRPSSSGHIPTAPVVPLVDPSTSVAVPSTYRPMAKSDFGPTLDLYSTAGPNPESKSPTVRSELASSARSHVHSSKPPLRSPSPPAVTFNLIREPDSGTDNNSHIPISQPASKEENLSRDLKIPSNTPPPPPPLFPVSVPAPARSLRLSEAAPNELQHHIGSDLSHAIPDEIHDETVIDANLSQEPIKLVRLLFFSFEGDHPLDVPPSEDELKACHMTEELWKELQTDAQRFWYPPLPENMALTLHEWNTNIFSGHGAQIALCEVFPDTHNGPSRFAFYFFSSAKALPPAEGNNYSPLPQGLRRLDIFDFSPPPITTVSDVAVLVGPEDIPADRHWARRISLISGNLGVSARRGLGADLDNGISPVNS